MAELEELSLQLDLQGLCAELKWLTQRRADRAWRQFKKPTEQTFTLFLAFICEEAKRAGITLGNDFLVHQLLAQVRARQERAMLMVYVSNHDKLAAEADKLLQSAFGYGPLQDDTAMVDCVGDDSDSEDEQVCAVTRGAHPKRSKGEERHCFMCVAERATLRASAPSAKTASRRAVVAATRRRRPAGVARAAGEAKMGFSAYPCAGVHHSSS